MSPIRKQFLILALSGIRYKTLGQNGPVDKVLFEKIGQFSTQVIVGL